MALQAKAELLYIAMSDQGSGICVTRWKLWPASQASLNGCKQCSPVCPITCWLERSMVAVSMPCRTSHSEPVSLHSG